MKYNFIYQKKKIIIDVTIKGNNEIHKLNFIVDTGASSSIIDEDTVRLLGLSTANLEKASFHTVGGRANGKILSLPTIGVFNKIFRNCTLAVINLSPFVSFYCNGLIGNDLLQKFGQLKIDYVNKIIEV